MLGHLRGELADDSPASRGTPRMHDATSGVSTFEAQGQAAGAIGVEADAVPGEFLDRERSLLAKDSCC